MKKFLRPTKSRIGLFIVIFLVFVFFFMSYNVEIFPCKTRPVIPNPPEYQDNLCSITPPIGSSIVFTPLGYIVLFVVLIIVPYLVGCALSNIIRKK